MPEWAGQLARMNLITELHVYCGRHNETLLGFGGVHKDWSGTGRCWVILTPYAQQEMPVGTVLAIRRILAKVAQEEGYKRIEAHADCTDAEAVKLLRVLGFRREGRCQQYLPGGKDAYLYAWVRGRPARKVS